MAVWVQEEGDKGEEFEYQMTVISPGSGEEKQIMAGTFTFSAQIHRFVANLFPISVDGAGTLRLQSRLRRSGQQEWLCQEFLIDVEVVEQPQPQVAQ